MLKIKVILGSIREGRFGEQPAHWIVDELKKNSNLEVELLDLRDYQLPMFDEAVPPAMNKGNYMHPEAKAWAEKIAEADGFVIVTPEYNRGYSSALKNNIDYVYNEWNKKPVAFVAYGNAGGARAVEQLRLVSIELQMAPIRQAVHIFEHWNLQDEQGKADLSSFQKKADGMIQQLIWWANALKAAREQ
jgi:NAD(P)H-dependent FMN reductase